MVETKPGDWLGQGRPERSKNAANREAPFNSVDNLVDLKKPTLEANAR
jgi:hypothetical protein